MSSVLELIRRKRGGQRHTAEEIAWLIRGYLEGQIPDYQMAAWLMAVYFRGLDAAETYALTEALLRSGEVLDLSAVPGTKVDKHSTGGVGDKTSLVVVPLARAAGAVVVKLAGRALGHTGGTLDKLEAIPGMRVDLTAEEIVAQARRTGMVLAGHTATLVPADKKLYALRDVTATADCPPLIAASIMSKKLATGADALVLDVKVGEGGFLRRREEARALAAMMVALGRQAGRPTAALLTRMDEPLGAAVGNALEVEEAVATLKGGGPPDLRELSLSLAAQMLLLAGLAKTAAQAHLVLEEALATGRAWRAFQELVAAQGGQVAALEEGLPRAPYTAAVRAPRSGYVRALAARPIGEAVARLGGGRTALGQAVDPAVGVILYRKTGAYVRRGEELALVYGREKEKAEMTAHALTAAWRIGQSPPAPRPLIYEVLS
ncbi:MAG: thymidine phosphorylase [Clostridia bacterium]|nr:thymidine phosphorylase [Clostridia bacterium]